MTIYFACIYAFNCEYKCKHTFIILITAIICIMNCNMFTYFYITYFHITEVVPILVTHSVSQWESPDH